MHNETNDNKAIEEGCYFNKEIADKQIRFIETYCIPSTLGKTIKLLPWQKHIVRELAGWLREDGTPRFTRATISTAKKQGKTLLVSSLLLNALINTNIPSPFVVSASTSINNASQVYRELAYSIMNNRKLNKICKCVDSLKEIKYPKRNARYKSLSSDSASHEGENSFFTLIDETHAHQSNKLYRSLEYSTIARKGLFVNISTAGNDVSHFWYDIFKYAQSVQNGQLIDTSLFPYICTIPENADIENPNIWRLSNPSMAQKGEPTISFGEDDFRRDLQRAKNGGVADFISFKRYRLNMWTQSSENWIDALKWDRCAKPLRLEEYKNMPLYIGCDLSQVSDPSSITLVFCLPDNKYYIISHAWVCEEGVKSRSKEASNMPKYLEFQAEGSMTISKGSVNDYFSMHAFLKKCKAQYNLKEIIFDQYNAMEMAGQLQAENITVYRQPQTHNHFTSPMKSFEVALNEQRIMHDGNNKFLRWSLANTKLDIDSFQNYKPSREKSVDKIDATISTVMAFGRACALSAGTNKKSVYEGRGVFII